MQGENIGEKGQNVESGVNSKCNEKLIASKQGSDVIQFNGL